MSRPNHPTRQALFDSTLRLVYQGGLAAATTRAIARETGITEGAIYKHFRTKEQLHRHAYDHVIQEMMAEKRHLADSGLPFPQTLHEWVRLSYAYFDRHPQAFTYVLLLTPPVPDSGPSTASAQGRLFLRLIAQAVERGDVRPIRPEIALSHFVGIMLNVPRLINERVLVPPASAYVDEVADAAWRALKP